MHWSLGECKSKVREGSGEGGWKDRHDGMALKALMTLQMNKLSLDLEYFIAEGLLSS